MRVGFPPDPVARPYPWCYVYIVECVVASVMVSGFSEMCGECESEADLSNTCVSVEAVASNGAAWNVQHRDLFAMGGTPAKGIPLSFTLAAATFIRAP